MSTLAIIVTLLAFLAVAAAIAIFEKPRAKRIERDLGSHRPSGRAEDDAER